MQNKHRRARVTKYIPSGTKNGYPKGIRFYRLYIYYLYIRLYIYCIICLSFMPAASAYCRIGSTHLSVLSLQYNRNGVKRHKQVCKGHRKAQRTENILSYAY